jgi:hypothetical protein
MKRGMGYCVICFIKKYHPDKLPPTPEPVHFSPEKPVIQEGAHSQQVPSPPVSPTGPKSTPPAQQSSWWNFGDLAEKTLSAVGITKDRVEKWIGPECGCKERQDKMNRFGQWLKKKIAGEDSDCPVE